jgi:hypothetical protein
VSPVCSANAITETNSAHDTKRSSSNNGVALANTCGGFTSNACLVRKDQDVDTPDSSAPEGTSTRTTPPEHDHLRILHGSWLSAWQRPMLDRETPLWITGSGLPIVDHN